MKRQWLIWLPFVLVLLMFGIFYLGLRNPGDHIIASNVVGQALPEFRASPAIPGQPGAATEDFRDGKPRLLNVFASWCVPCIREIPVLMRLKAQGVDIAGITIHDTPPAVALFLSDNGNPYSRIGLDAGGRAQLAFGSSGVPETFVVDGSGMIVHQHIGVVTEADIPILLAKLGRDQ